MANTYTYMQIQSSRAGERNRGEEQGAEERAGGRSSEQGRALTLGLGAPAGRSRGAATGSRRVPCREADGSPTGRRTGSRWVPREADARRAPAGRSSSRGLEGPCREKQREAGGGRRGGWRRRRRDGSSAAREGGRGATGCAAPTVVRSICWARF